MYTDKNYIVQQKIMIDRIKLVLEQEFPDSQIIIVDQSHLHADHIEAKSDSSVSHILIKIDSETLSKLKSLERHQRVNKVLKQFFAEGLHAASINFRKK